MGYLESKAVNALLRRIRSRKRADSANSIRLSHPARAAAPAKVREATFSDYKEISDLKRRGGIVVDSIENWQRIWAKNPALDRMPSLPIGWVLEAEGKIVGYLGNIALLYRYGHQSLTAVTGTGFVVDPEYRAYSLTLDSAFYRQKTADLHLATTAIEAVGKLALAFRSAPLPQPGADTLLFWVLQPYTFAQAVLRKLDLVGPCPGVGNVLAAIAIESDRIVRRRRPFRRASNLDVDEIEVAGIGDEFQAFWNRKLSERTRMYADRSAATLRWHFEIPGCQGAIRILRCRRGKDMVGYAAVRDDIERSSGLRRSLIADMLAEKDDFEIVRVLLVAAFTAARRAKNDILETIGFPQAIRHVLEESKPYHRKLPACPFYYRASNPELHRALADSSSWYACAFDGDTTMMP